MSAEIIETLAGRIMELARENARLVEENTRLRGVERRALTVEQIADLLGVARSTVDRWIDRGRIPVFELPSTTDEPKPRKYKSVRAWNTDLITHFAARAVEAAEGAASDAGRGP